MRGSAKPTNAERHLRSRRSGKHSGQHRGARPFHSAPVAEQTTGIRLLNGTTQVQFLPGANCRSGGYAECAPRFSVSATAQSIPLNAQSVRPAC